MVASTASTDLWSCLVVFGVMMTVGDPAVIIPGEYNGGTCGGISIKETG